MYKWILPGAAVLAFAAFGSLPAAAAGSDNTVDLSAPEAAQPSPSIKTTNDDLLKAGDKSEANNWLMVHRSYDSHRYSPLTEINDGNIGDLHLAFVTTFDNASRGGRYQYARNEGTPLVEDGFMYVQTGWSVIYKVDVRSGKSGKIVWKYDPQVDRQWISDAVCCGAENRGVALWHDDVIALTMDGRVISLNKDTGEVNWEEQRADKARGESFTGAPMVVGDEVIYGPAGGEFGIRGWLEALDVKTGKQLWKTYTIPAPGEPGSDTWQGDAWKTGGASIWETGSYDPDSGIMYWGTGNPAPQIDAQYRPGDNLYASSLLALDVKTGKMKWYYQFTPNDPFDYDEIGDSQLLKVNIDGKPTNIVVHVARDGLTYGFNQQSGKLLYAEPYVEDLTWTTGIDLKTGLPNEYDPKSMLQKYVKGSVGSRTKGDLDTYCPTLSGGKNWQPAAYSEQTKLLYFTSAEGCSVYQPTEAPNPTTTGGTYNVVQNPEKEWGGRLPAPDDAKIPDVFKGGSIVAIDPITGETVHKILLPNRGQGLLATGGNLVFASFSNGNLTAYDAKTLKQVWNFNAGTGLGGPPMTYAVDGKQYIAVLAGNSPNAADQNAVPQSQYFVPTDQLYVFAVD